MSVSGSLRYAVSQSISHNLSPSKRMLPGFGSLWLETCAGGVPRISLTDALESLDMPIEQTGSEGPPDVAQHSIEKNPVVAEYRERTRRLQVGGELSDGRCQPRRSARIILQRPLNHKVDDGHASRIIRITQRRRNAGLRGDPHTNILVWVAQRTAPRFHPQQIGSAIYFDPVRQGAGGASRHRLERCDGCRPEGGRHRRSRRVLQMFRDHFKPAIAHDSRLPPRYWRNQSRARTALFSNASSASKR